ncbi:ATP-binding protein [Nonomuraea cavernae]|uniref:Histidine kinase/HSP90-like ATPase domain-containing protein n=1 Tax=Nonomuraea cavernae TaxID=2045107 RepID=A0A917Z958_9ACTN|nr:ATP-binding protein [Nonomuraea cavernae]MCA2185648.1 ATP-binding protein [Nonomuraea cavernae]GGO78158.1 hypothetical protein GCM10012289_59510 [Nonomuraea cavernae]
MKEALKARTALAEHRPVPDRLLPVLGDRWIPRADRCLSSARRFVRDVALDWQAGQDVAEVAELLVSELVTNAITHGGAGAVRVSVLRERELMVVDVHDSCPTLPCLRLAGRFDVGGRGLAIVQTLSHDWGWTVAQHGKSVWFQLIAWPECS